MKKSDDSNFSAKEALSALKRICSKEEKCIDDVRHKLSHWGITGNNADKVISLLLKEQFIDEIRYSTFFANDKIKFNKWGRIKITFALRQKHIPEEVIEQALTGIDQELYYKILKEELLKKFKTLHKEPAFQLREKLYRFAASRGFESDLIKTTINEIMQNT